MTTHNGIYFFPFIYEPTLWQLHWTIKRMPHLSEGDFYVIKGIEGNRNWRICSKYLCNLNPLSNSILDCEQYLLMYHCVQLQDVIKLLVYKSSNISTIVKTIKTIAKIIVGCCFRLSATKKVKVRIWVSHKSTYKIVLASCSNLKCLQ